MELAFVCDLWIEVASILQNIMKAPNKQEQSNGFSKVGTENPER
jgi:hypothetical protein